MKNSEQIKEETEKLRLNLEKNHINGRASLKKGLTMYIVEELILGTGKIINNKNIDITKLTEETTEGIESLLKECTKEAVSISKKIIEEVAEKKLKQNG